MIRSHRLFDMALGFAVVACSLLASHAVAQERAILDNSESPHSRLRSVDLDDVKWTDGFWADKFNVVKDVTIPKMWEYFHTDIGHHWINFRIASGLDEGPWKGRSWHDGDFYKWLEAMAYVYQVTGDAKLDRWMDEVVEVIGKAQEPDGYLSTHVILESPERFQDLHEHELYNMGHLMTVACIHHRVTGKTSLLKTARKTGDFLYATFKNGKPELAPFGFNPSNIMGAVELYRTTGDKKYLELANIFINNRGTSKVGETITREQAKAHACLPCTDRTQDRVPLRQETEAVGHAVTATYLYCGAADAHMETGDQGLMSALDRIWHDVTRRKMYIHGGVGPFTHGLSIRHDVVGEAFGDAYFLPNRKCYCETCANIGFAMWNWRMLNITAEAKYADVMERVLFNSGISGLGLDGDSFLYTNVLRRFGNDVPMDRSDRSKRWKERTGYCCPPQLARTIAQMHGYCYSTSHETLWVHFYGGNTLETTLPDEIPVKLRQTTDYPWNGAVRLTLESAPDKAFNLKLRIPRWAVGATVRVNGRLAETELDPGRYATLRRSWTAGDTVELDLPMRVRLMEANPLVEETRGQAAVMRGPVLYCLESVDLPEGVRVADVRLPKDIELKDRFDKDLLGGITVLEGQAVYRTDAEWSEQPYDAELLYREITNVDARSLELRLVPYHVWLNRGISQMSVWLPFD